MDPILELMKSMDKEDKLKEELFKTQTEKNRLIMDNLIKFVDGGLVKVEINRLALNRMMGRYPQRTKVMG